MISHNISIKEGQNCTFGQQIYGNCLLGCWGMHQLSFCWKVKPSE